MHTLTKLVEKLKKGVYMNGLILSDCGSVCSCGGEFKTKNDIVTKIKYPACQKCGMPPVKLRVRKNFPSPSGKVFKKDYSSFNGKPLDSVMSCLELIGQLNKEILSTDFKIEKYSSRANELLSFENVANKYLKTSKERLAFPQEHDDYLSPGGYKTIKSNVDNHLIPYFKERISYDDTGKEVRIIRYIYEIDDDAIVEFQKSYLSKFRARDKALGELKALLNFAYRKKLISTKPNFPKIKRAREIAAREIPNLDVQEKIIWAIEDQQYQDMYILTATLPCRPCETCAFHVEDVDFLRGGIHIKRHFSGSVLIPGRKSIKAHEELGEVFHRLDKDMMDRLEKYTVNKLPGDPLFPGKISRYVALTTFREAWQKARTLVSETVTSYIGTKHATLSDFRTRFGAEGLAKRSKHKDEKTALRYGKDKNEDNELISSERFALKKSGGRVVGEILGSGLVAYNY